MTADPLSPAVPRAVHEGEGFDPSCSAGFFVGVSRFEDALLAEVPFAVDDAVDLAHLFVVELGLMEAPRVLLSLAGEPRKEASRERLASLVEAGARRVSARVRDVYDGLDRQRKAAGPEGLLVATFATHGFSDQGRDFLVASDSLRRRIELTGVKIAAVFDDVARSPSPRRLVLLDACRERLTSATRGSGEVSSPMSASFLRAISEASGQVVLAGTTLGGYSYDDPSRGNGVFTGTILDGLRGRAPADARGFITVRTLADWADERVVSWVRDHCPDHAHVSQGITRQIEGAAARLPLAIDPARRQAEEADRRRREAALVRLRENLGGVLTGALYDEIVSYVEKEPASAELSELLEEIEALDGEARTQRSLAHFWKELVEEVATAPLPVVLKPDLSGAPPSSGIHARAGGGSPPRYLGWLLAALVTLGIGWGVWKILSDRQPVDPEAPVETVDDGGSEAATPPPPVPAPQVLEKTSARPAMVRVPAGIFQMGSPEDEPGRLEWEAQHQVKISKDFYLSRTEVTQAQYEQVMESTPSSNKACGDDCPVTDVSWLDAVRYANALASLEKLEPCYEIDGDSVSWSVGLRCEGYRLPTEAEWEYAARAGSPDRYAGVDKPEGVCRFGNVADGEAKRKNPRWTVFSCDDGYPALAPVAQFETNGFGLNDMTGNVWEWVWDWYVADYGGAVMDPISPRYGQSRVIRSGSFYAHPQSARVAFRSLGGPSFSSDDVGFRVARSLP